MAMKQKTLYEEIREAGHSRRDFLRFCSMMAAYLGLESSGVAQVVEALETKPRLPVVWFHFSRVYLLQRIFYPLVTSDCCKM